MMEIANIMRYEVILLVIVLVLLLRLLIYCDVTQNKITQLNIMPIT